MNNFSIAQRPFGDIILNRLRRSNKTTFDLAQYLGCEKQHLERALFGEVPLVEVCKLGDLEKYFGTSEGYFTQVFLNCTKNNPKYYDKPPMVIKLNLQSGADIVLIPFKEDPDPSYDKLVENLKRTYAYPNIEHLALKPGPTILHDRVKAIADSTSFKLLTPEKHGLGHTALTSSCRQEVDGIVSLTTCPIAGVASTKIIKGREADATPTGDKHVFSDKLKNTIETLKSDRLVGEYPNVVFGTKRLLALMDDPEFIKVIENATTDKLSEVILKALHNRDKPNNLDNTDDELVLVPKWLLQCLYDIACEHNYPIAADACEILAKHRKGDV